MGYLETNVSFHGRPSMPGKETPPDIMKKIVWLDSSEIPGAPYFEIVWFVKERAGNPPEHTHDWDEFIGFIGSDPEDPGDLHATVEFMLDGEKLTLTRSCIIYVPAGVPHCPFGITQIDRPILHFSGGNGSRY